ncbi:ABC transporter permease [Mobilitalea sibirica]|uniref:ABC transporter permease n=1 Tax=Mobilitalea sibirica TaxID=1462919 RepID=UPI002ECFCFDE
MSRVYNNFKKYRFLLAELVKKEIKLKYRRSYLGILWTLLEPLLTTIVLTVVFSNLLGRGDNTFPVYILTGRLLYTFFSNSTKTAMKAIRSNSAMIKKVYVPKYIYPFSSVLSSYLIFMISLIILVVAMVVFRVTPTLHLFEAVIPLALLLVLSLGVGMILSTMAVFFRDLEYLWGVVLMIVMYTSAIFYIPETLKLGDKIWIFNLNPLYVVIVNFRNAVFGNAMDMEALLLSIVYSFGSLLFGIFLFYKKQDKFILNI